MYLVLYHLTLYGCYLDPVSLVKEIFNLNGKKKKKQKKEMIKAKVGHPHCSNGSKWPGIRLDLVITYIFSL